jgi:hypothetical protein
MASKMRPVMGLNDSRTALHPHCPKRVFQHLCVFFGNTR